jgi:hypothetical protein
MNISKPDTGHEPDWYCGAKDAQHGGTCKNRAGKGTTHVGIGACKHHGGSTRNHVKFAEVEIAKRSVNLWGGRRDVHPAQALLELVQWKASECAYWRYRVAEIAEEDLTWGTTKVKTGGDDRGTTEEAKPHIALVMLRQAEKDLAEFAAASLRAGVEASLVEVAKSQASQLAAVLRALVSDPRVSVDGPADVVIVDALRVLERPAIGETA